jgi:O-antigen ligase
MQHAVAASHLSFASRVDTESRSRLWGNASTWGLMLLLLYFALDGVSPFVNEPTATRVVATTSAGGMLFDRLSKLLMCAGCLHFALGRYAFVRQMCQQNKLITSFPLLALAFSPLSQLPTRTISSGALLLGSILLLYSVMSRYTFDQVLELFLVLGTATIVASVMFALLLPEYGLDRLGGHDNAWKGIFSAKNYLGNLALFFLTVAVSYRAQTGFMKALQCSQMLLCCIAILFSRAATAYLLTAFYLVYLGTMWGLRRFRKKDRFVVAAIFLVCVGVAIAVVATRPDFLVSLLGRDITLTGRTEIWNAVLTSIAKRPLCGYGYQAFWLGLEGESYHVILAVSWMLAQAQNGFLDVTLQLGLVGLTIVVLVFVFALRDAAVCLLHWRNAEQLRSAEWYLAIVLLTLIYNLDESFLFDPKHLGSMMFLMACVGLKREWISLRT